MEDYEREWQEYKRYRNFLWYVFVSYVPGAIMIGWLGFKLFGNFIPGYVAAIVWMGAFLFAGVRLNTWRCPWCGEWFSQTYWYHLGFFARRCVHCGLPKYAKTAEKYTRPGELHLTD